MEKVKRNAVAERRASKIDLRDLLARAGKRVELPQVPMNADYQEDVDTLCIRFEADTSSFQFNSDAESGVIGIYRGKQLIGLEILDITGQLEYANPQ